MITFIRNTAIASLTILTLTTVSAFSADMAPKQTAPVTLSVASAVQLLSAAGYNDVRKVEIEHGFYEATVRDKDGSRLKIVIDPKTGIVTVKEKRVPKTNLTRDGKPRIDKYALPPRSLSLGEVSNLLEQKGYRVVHSIKAKRGIYQAKVTDERGMKTKITIDPVNGTIQPGQKSVTR
ncbi:MAG: PepSY domain-containing protein [Alphaproteobacteria bacterium]|nr:PepSY domain-containing protein [Rhodospirillales bacterium]MCW9046183.1 PepSY domain-containing protein [Alphaproteobacteria bacterium]